MLILLALDQVEHIARRGMIGKLPSGQVVGVAQGLPVDLGFPAVSRPVLLAWKVILCLS